jgi:hypothetical protein
MLKLRLIFIANTASVSSISQACSGLCPNAVVISEKREISDDAADETVFTDKNYN